MSGYNLLLQVWHFDSSTVSDAVDLRRNGKQVGTLSLRIKASDPKANAELALRNVIRDVHSKYEPAAKAVDNVDELAESGKRQILSDLAQSFANCMPVVGAVMTGMDMVAAVSFIHILSLFLLSILPCRPIHTSTSHGS